MIFHCGLVTLHHIPFSASGHEHVPKHIVNIMKKSVSSSSTTPEMLSGYVKTCYNVFVYSSNISLCICNATTYTTVQQYC